MKGFLYSLCVIFRYLVTCKVKVLFYFSIEVKITVSKSSAFIA